MGKISSYPAMTALQGPELILGDQSGSTATTTPTAVAAYMAGLTTTPVIASYARTAAEIAAGVTPVNYAYAPGDLRRYGGDPTGVADSSAAFLSAIKTGFAFIPAACSFYISTSQAVTGQVTIIGQGPTSKLLCDTTVLTVTNGTGSFVDNFWMENITAPWIITRDPTNWSANILGTLQQSNTVLGYQPTVNDADIWGSLTTAQQNQQVGPQIIFKGSASDITVSRIFGRFVLVLIQDATNSTIRDCDVRGGKGEWGTLQFDNWTNEVQRGSGNRAINNRVQYGSFSGITFMANDDFVCQGNQSFLNGESGTKTVQVQGVQFTASVGGATSGTISVPAGGLTNGTWNFIFADGESRSVTVTGSTSCSWTGALTVTSILSASAYQGNINPQCFRGLITNNSTYENYYDGLDCDSTFNTTVDAARTYHVISQNSSYNNGGDGVNTDGRYNTVEGNRCYGNRSYGIWNLSSYSQITGNHLLSNNTQNGSSIAELLGGTQANVMSLNKILFSASAGYPIYAPQIAGQIPHVIRDNFIIGGTAFYGNASARFSVLENNIDDTTGSFTLQSFCFFLQNNAGTLQHVFYSDGGAASSGIADRISGETSGGYTNTPTGTDSSTAFASGAKVSTTVPNAIVFNTGVQDPPNSQMVASLVYNTTTTALIVRPRMASFDVNGVTQSRLIFELFNASTGAPVAINTTNIGSGTLIQIQFYGRFV